MTPEQIEGIFKPFAQAETGTTRKYGGTGLGLSIAKGIIEMMGGKLSVESEPGIGSKFSFELTLDTIDASEKDLLESKITPMNLRKPIFSGEVLLCEDNAMNRQVICEHLARVGLKTVVAENGKIGADMAQNRMLSGEKQFDLIFMDMHMPVMDGFEAATKILALNTGVPVVALTANVMEHDKKLYESHGITGYLGKPFTSRELWRRLARYLPVENYTYIASRYQSTEDEKIQKRLKATFVKSNQAVCAEIMKAVDAGDIKTAHRLAHTLKSNAGQIGENKLQAAAVVERNLSEGKSRLDMHEMRSLEAELGYVLEELAPLPAEPKKKAEAEVKGLRPAPRTIYRSRSIPQSLN